MAARSEHGAPSALTVLEVAEGLRWTDPALGASLAEHVRRVAGDDPAVRAAADRSLLRSLVESGRHQDVVERGVPLLAEARERGDRDDGAAVLVDLAVAATELGDAGLAGRLLDRLGPLGALPARIGAAAYAARAEMSAVDGDVPATDAAADEAGPTLFRVPRTEAAVLRGRITLARGVARRRAGDVAGALTALGGSVSTDPSGDVDGGRRSMIAAAEECELLIEVGRHEEARARARQVLPDGPPGPHDADAVGRIRLASLAASEAGTTAATATAEQLEAAGRTAGAARAWELVAELAEADGDLGGALAALRHGHRLASTARDAGDRALRALAAVADGADPLAVGTPTAVRDTSAPVAENGVRSGRRRRPDPPDDVPFPTAAPENSGGELAPVVEHGGRNGTHPGTVPSASITSPPEVTGAAKPEAAEPETSGRPLRAADPAVADPPPTADPGPSRSTRDELAELLASLTRSMDSSRASASAMGLEPAPSTETEPSGGGETTPQDTDPERSRHAAPFDPNPPAAGEPTASRPTFDAFSTAPFHEAGATVGEMRAPTVDPLPDDRFAAVAGVEAPDRSTERSPTDAPSSVSSLLDPLLDPFDVPRGGSAEGAPDTVAAGPRGDDVLRRVDTGDVAVGPPGSDTPAGPHDAADHPVVPDRGTAADRAVVGPEAAWPTDPTPSTEAPATGTAALVDETTPVRPVPAPGPSSDFALRNGNATGSATTGTTTPSERGERSTSTEERPSSTSAATARPSGRDRTGRAEGELDGARRGDVARGRAPSPGPRERRETPAPPSSTAPDPGRGPAPAADEYEEDLALTLATVLGEYHLPDVPMPPRRDRDRPVEDRRPPAGNAPAGEVAVPSARRHTSGSMPVPAEQRWAPHRESSANRADGAADETRRNGAGANGRGRPPESGAKLADLLAEAMDAFRHVGPESQEGPRGPGVGSRRA